MWNLLEMFLEQISITLVWKKFGREESFLYFVLLFLAIGVLVQVTLDNLRGNLTLRPRSG